MSESKYLLVMGVGNELLTDDGAGVHAVRALAAEEWPEGVDFIEGGTCTQDIFYLFKGYTRLLVLDVVKSGREPGTLYSLSEADLVGREGQRLSLHDIDLLDSLKMAELAGGRPVMDVVGVEPEDFTSWSMQPTETIRKVMPKFLELARRRIREIMVERGDDPGQV